MINFTLRDVAIKQLIIALKVFTILIFAVAFFCFFKSIEGSLVAEIITAALIIFVFILLIGVLFPNLHNKEEKDEESEVEQCSISALFFLFILVIIKCFFITFFYDEFMARLSEILPYLCGYALIYVLVVAFHLLSKKMKVGYPEGLIDEYQKASEQKGEDVKLFTNDSGVLPNISDLDKNITKNINIKSL